MHLLPAVYLCVCEVAVNPNYAASTVLQVATKSTFFQQPSSALTITPSCLPTLQVATKSTFFQQPDFYGVDLTALHAPATAGYFGQARPAACLLLRCLRCLCLLSGGT